MTHDTLLRYSPVLSPLHRVDARVKIISLVLLATAAMAASPVGLLPMFLASVAALVVSSLPLRRLLRESRGFLFLAAAILAASVVTAEEIDAGLVHGLIYIGRLGLLVVLGEVLIATTTVDEIRQAIRRLLVFLPARWSSLIGMLMSLSISFVSLPSLAAAEARTAALARGLSPRRRPVRYMRLITHAMLVRTLLEADSRANSLALRGGISARRATRRRLALSDWSSLAFAVAVSGFALVL